MSFFTDKTTKEAQLTALLDACIVQLQFARKWDHVKTDEREKAVVKVYDAIPVIRRYFTYLRTKELEVKK